MATKFKIEKVDLPIPDSVKRGRTFRFPFDTMEAGGCFIVKGMTRNTLGSYKAYAEKSLGRKFVSKKVNGGIAIWRIR